MKSVLYILRNTSGLTSQLNDGADSIYVSIAENTEDAPYLIVDSRLLTPYDSADSGSNNGIWLFTILCFAYDFSTVRSIADSVNSTLDNLNWYTYDGELIQRARLVSDDTDSIKEANKTYYMIELNFEIFLTK